MDPQLSKTHLDALLVWLSPVNDQKESHLCLQQPDNLTPI